MDKSWDLIIQPVGGLSGDMMLGGLLALFSDKEKSVLVEEIKKSLPLEFSLNWEKKQIQAIETISVEVRDEESGHHHRHYADIEPIINEFFPLNLAENKKWNSMAKRMFRALAEAEGKVHGKDWREVHFHEVGAVDSLVDILGSLYLLKKLEVKKLYHTSPLPFVASGIIEGAAHGLLPTTAPATSILLAGKKLELVEENLEMITPTGALFLQEAEELKESFSYQKIGYGAGKRKLKKYPNYARFFLGEVEEEVKEGEVVEISFNVDDMSPQALTSVYELLDQKNVLDVFVVPYFGKKNRTGQWVNILAREEKLPEVVDFIFTHTTTAGVRYTVKKRWEQDRKIKEITLSDGSKVKVKIMPYSVIPEYEDCKKIALQRGEPVYKVIEEVRSYVNGEGKKM